LRELQANLKQDYDSLGNAFRALDADGSGKIGKDEIAKILESLNVGEARSKAILAAADKDGDGEIEFDEFKQAFAPEDQAWGQDGLTKNQLRGQMLRLKDHVDTKFRYVHEAFRNMDEDHGGEISAEELAEGLANNFNLGLNKAHLAQLVDEFDTDHDGKITYAEFAQKLRERAESAEGGNFFIGKFEKAGPQLRQFSADRNLNFGVDFDTGA